MEVCHAKLQWLLFTLLSRKLQALLRGQNLKLFTFVALLPLSALMTQIQHSLPHIVLQRST